MIPVNTEAVWAFPYFSSVAELTYLATNHVRIIFCDRFVGIPDINGEVVATRNGHAVFGLYGLSGSVTAFLAPLLVAVVTDISQSQRVGFASVILILIGGLMLGWVREEQATRA